MMIKRAIKTALHSLGVDVVRYPYANLSEAEGANPKEDFSAEDRAIYERVRPFTMTTIERTMALISSVRHVCRNNIAGDFVECGVWKGGSTMAAALTFLAEGNTSRQLHLYDTFEGMPPPRDDVDIHWQGQTASAMQAGDDPESGMYWARAALNEVKANVGAIGYPPEKINYIVGKVEDTIPTTIPNRISLLRLDTDWYESTLHELTHLYPLLSAGGLLIIDDYGAWTGAKKATEEFLETLSPRPFLHRIDFTGRLIIKL
jgi:O-methyltransferase